jgi:hypothetical protein
MLYDGLGIFAREAATVPAGILHTLFLTTSLNAKTII